MDRKYVVLQETSGEECESWYYFIKLNGNEDNLKKLDKLLSQVKWEIIDDYSTFDLDLDHPVSEQTAREICRLDINHYNPHRKFDGHLKEVVVNMKTSHSNDKKIRRFFDVLGYGGIDKFIDQEDIDPITLASRHPPEEDGSSEDSSESESSPEEKKAHKHKHNKKK